MFSIPNRSRLSDDVPEQIRLLIEEKRLRPGDQLPSERDLARILGVSRTSLREGLRRLEVTGVVEVRAGKGIYLRSDLEAPLDRVIRSWFVANKENLRELVELREPLETQAAGLAAQRATPEDFRTMEQAIAVMRLATDANSVERFVDADTVFHDAVAQASKNGLLRRALALIAREAVDFRLATSRLGPSVLQRSLADHEAVYLAIRARDVRAARLSMRTHIVQTPREFGLFAETANPSPANESDTRH